VIQFNDPHGIRPACGLAFNAYLPQMQITPHHHRPFGSTALQVPPIMFRTCALGNSRRVITNQSKLAICGEWFKNVSPPVLINISLSEGDETAIRAVARALDRLEISPQEVTLCLTLSGHALHLSGESTINALHDAARAIGGKHWPQLVLIDASTHLASATAAQRRVRLSEIQTTCTALAKTKLNDTAAVGIAADDWRLVKEIQSAVELDWINLIGGVTLFQHSPEMLDFLAEQADRRVAVVASSVFQGGFLLGGSNLGDRTIDPQAQSDQKAIAWRKAFAALCQGHGVDPAHACIQFCLAVPGVVAVSVDTSHADRIAKNAQHAATVVTPAFWASMKEEGLLADHAFI
jgi:D-threo-aldose 1-dehydrogenase